MKTLRFWLFALLAVTLLPVTAQAQDEEDTNPTDGEPAWPVLTINLSSIDRVREHIDFVFGLIDRPEITDLVNAQLANVRDLKGIHPEKPGGLMIFLSEGLAPLPIPVAYVPVEDIGELTQTVETMGAQIDAVPGEEGYYEFIPRNGATQYVVLDNGYAFFGASRDSIDREFARPEVFAAKISNQYDICISANLSKTPKAVRKLVLGTIRVSSQASMQQRDNEPEAAYKIRRAGAESNLEFIEQLLTEGEEATLGFKVDPAKKQAYLELVVRAQDDSNFADELLEATGKTSSFHAAIDETVPISVSYSANIPERDRKTLLAIFDAGVLGANRELSNLPEETLDEDIPQLEGVRAIFDSLRATTKEGHLDAFVQMFGEPPEKFVLVGGIKLLDAEGFGVGLTDLLQRARSSDSDTEIEMSVASHGDVVFHRLTGKEGPNRRDQRLFGDKPAMYVGTGHGAVWFAIGGEQAVPTLGTAIDKVVASGSAPPARQLSPFQFVMNMNHFVRMNAATRENPGRFNELATEAFDQTGSDMLRLDGKAIENGFRIRLQFENGFLRLLGMGIAARIDRSQDL